VSAHTGHNHVSGLWTGDRGGKVSELVAQVPSADTSALTGLYLSA
jgi:hypothetical protein